MAKAVEVEVSIYPVANPRDGALWCAIIADALGQIHDIDTGADEPSVRQRAKEIADRNGWQIVEITTSVEPFHLNDEMLGDHN